MKEKVENPWKKIKGTNYYTDNDEKIIKNFNDRVTKNGKEDSPFYIDLKLMPEPYIGNKDANVILLFTNPGLKKTELAEYDEYTEFYKSLKKNLTHSNKEYPYYYFNPAFKKEIKGKEKYIAGAEWILKRTKELRKRLGNDCLKLLSKGIFTFQLHPYHSTKYKALPELEVGKYTEYLFKKAVERVSKGDGIIICIRSYDEWNKLYKKVFDTTNDFASDLSDKFVLLKNKNEKTPRTPFFSETLLRKNNFDRLVELLLKQSH